MKKKRVLVWFRNDLRVHDNEALLDGCSASDQVIPVYVFDSRKFTGYTKYGFRKTGIHRARFIVESIEDLRHNLRLKGCDLVVRMGHPEKVIYELAKKLNTSWIFCNRERTDEEVRVQDALEQNLWSIGQEVRYSRGKMLYYTADLPFPVTQTPDTFTQFRKEIEKIVPVRDVLPEPEVIDSSFDELDPGQIPDLSDLGFNDAEIFELDQPILSGGEKAGLKRLNDFFSWCEIQDQGQEVHLGLDLGEESSRFSAYLAHGCLSPKKIFERMSDFDQRQPAQPLFQEMFYGLLWRDYFRLIGKRYGNAIFKRGGTKDTRRDDLTNNTTLFNIWSEGRTGVPLVDAAIRQLNSTGYIPAKARKAAASFLVNDMLINWQLGAEYYESKLIDYDPCSNYVNWNYIAGVGNDSREHRHVPILFQSKKYDPDGDYVRRWIPALSILPCDRIHQTSSLSDEEASNYGLVIGKDYPRPFSIQ